MQFTHRVSALALICSLVACGGSDGGGETAAADSSTLADVDGEASATDSTPPPADGGTDGAVPFDCAGKTDGVDCGGGAICVKGVCASSSCGDGYVDTKGGEECEDGNSVSGDGCSACKFDCKSAADCDNALLCDGPEKCDTATHKCGAGTAATDGTACTSTSGSGTCKAGLCVAAGCGNGVKDGTEECDDGNAVDADGCTRLCRFTCKIDSDCDDGNACNGVEKCDTTTHKCGAGTPVTCSPKAGCTGSCDPSTGACAYPDADKDGVSCDKDCNDTDPAMFPGAFECKDGKDNDCNSATSDGTAPSCVCYADTDKDGYSAPGAATISSSATCPDGYTRRAPVDAANTDCGVFANSAHPGQTSYFAASFCKVLALGGCPAGSTSFDYDCSGGEEKRWTKVSTGICAAASSSLDCGNRSGWVTTIPTCGVEGFLRTCTWNHATATCAGTEAKQAQLCR